MTTPRKQKAKSSPAGAQAEAEERVMASPAMRGLTDELRTYPVRLLRQIVAEHSRRNGPVPDHVLDIIPYLGETALRALVDAGLASRLDDSPYAIRSYTPTADGLALAARMAGE